MKSLPWLRNFATVVIHAITWIQDNALMMANVIPESGKRWTPPPDRLFLFTFKAITEAT
jgi:hypothetical protein